MKKFIMAAVVAVFVGFGTYLIHDLLWVNYFGIAVVFTMSMLTGFTLSRPEFFVAAEIINLTFFFLSAYIGIWFYEREIGPIIRNA